MSKHAEDIARDKHVEYLIKTLQDPEASARLADSLGAEQRWLTVDGILLAIALFWLALAQISAGRLRLVTLAFGGLTLFASLAAFALIELGFFFTRGSL